MDISQLEVFLAVAREGGFSRAADKLYRTQSAVSQSVRKLEAEIGEPLFDRSSREGLLTDAGRVLQEYAERLINLRENAREALTELRELQMGKLVVGANELTALYLLRVLGEFRRLHPAIRIVVQRSLGSQLPDDASDQALCRPGKWRRLPAGNQRRGRNCAWRPGAHSGAGVERAPQTTTDPSQDRDAVARRTRLPESGGIHRPHSGRAVLLRA